MNELIEQLSQWMTGSIEATGIVAVFLLMVVESAGLPFPSEVTMPFAGFLSASGRLSFSLAVVAGGLGNLVGSLAAYFIAFRGGRAVIARFGQYLLYTTEDVHRAEAFFRRFGTVTVFTGRLLPIIRTYISFPAGLSRMSLTPFILYTTASSLMWSWLLTWIGFRLGSEWGTIKDQFRGLEVLVGVGLALLLILWIGRHLRHTR